MSIVHLRRHTGQSIRGIVDLSYATIEAWRRVYEARLLHGKIHDILLWLLPHLVNRVSHLLHGSPFFLPISKSQIAKSEVERGFLNSRAGSFQHLHRHSQLSTTST